MEKYKVLDIAGDIGLRAYGQTIEEAFINASIGMYTLTTDPDGVEERSSIEVALQSNSLERLLVSWLNELIFHFDAYGFVGKRIVFDEFFASAGLPQSLPVCRLKAVLYGEEFDPERHEGKLLIKAATYHRLNIEQRDDRWEISVVFDI
jgi:SHS2 domain-containing protein